MAPRRKRAYRITVALWTLVVIGMYLFCVVELPDWDSSGNLVPVLVPLLTILLPLVWFLGFGLVVFVFAAPDVRSGKEDWPP